jgi:hypothetical protein
MLKSKTEKTINEKFDSIINRLHDFHTYNIMVSIVQGFIKGIEDSFLKGLYGKLSGNYSIGNALFYEISQEYGKKYGSKIVQILLDKKKKERITKEAEFRFDKLDTKPGDLLLINSDESIFQDEYYENLFRELAQKHNIKFIHIKKDIRIQDIPEKEMEKMGWVRKEKITSQ